MALKLSESQEQQLVIQWCELMKNKYPGTQYIIHIANEGKRNPRTGARLKKEGMKKGILDLFLPCPKGKYAGLWIEMKSLTGKLTKEQKEWIEVLNNQGYKAICCKGHEEAIKTIEEYMKLK